MEDRDDMLMDHVNTNSRPGDLKITDIRVADIVGAPMHCTLVKVYTKPGTGGLWRSEGRRVPQLCAGT